MRLVDASTNSILNFSIFAWRENDTVAKFCLKFCMPEDVSVYEDLFWLLNENFGYSYTNCKKVCRLYYAIEYHRSAIFH